CSLPSCVSSRVVFDRRMPSVWVPSRRTVNHRGPDAAMSVADMIMPCPWLFRTWASGGGSQPVETKCDLEPKGVLGGSPTATEQAVDSLQSLFDGVDVHRHPGRCAAYAGAGVEVLPHGGKQFGGVQPVPLTEVGEHAVHESDHLVRCGAEHRGIGGEVLDRVDSLLDAEGVEDADARPHLVFEGAQPGSLAFG